MRTTDSAAVVAATPAGVFLIIFVIVAAVVAFCIRHWWKGRAGRAWREAARMLRLTFKPRGVFASRRIKGRHGPFEVRVYTYGRTTRGGEPITHFRLMFPALGLGLGVRRRKVRRTFVKFIRRVDIEVGDPLFDETTLVQGHSAKKIRAYLTRTRRISIDRLLAEYRGCVITDEEIHWAKEGEQIDPEFIVSTIKRFAGVARYLVKRPEDAERLEKAHRQRRAGKLKEALHEAREASREAPQPDPEAKAAEAQVLYTAGRFEESAGAFEELREELPKDPEVVSWSEHAASRSEEAEESEAEPALQPAAPDDHDTDPAALCEGLFGDEGRSLDTNRHFEEQFAGRAVQWSGTLLRAEGYSFDFVFGDERGCKALLVIHSVGNSRYGSRQVQAVVQLPAGTEDELRGRVDETITVRGKLIRCDAIMRNLYIANAQLVAGNPPA